VKSWAARSAQNGSMFSTSLSIGTMPEMRVTAFEVCDSSVTGCAVGVAMFRILRSLPRMRESARTPGLPTMNEAAAGPEQLCSNNPHT
jgi:hypothetical protein